MKMVSKWCPENCCEPPSERGQREIQAK